MSFTSLRLLADRWRSEAVLLRGYGAVEAAAAAERHAEEFEMALSGTMAESLSLSEAEVESGYSRSHLRKLTRGGKLPFVRTAGEIRILRRDLPRKPGFGVADLGIGTTSSRVQAARAVALREE